MAFDALGALELVPLASGVGRAFPGFALAQGVVELAEVVEDLRGDDEGDGSQIVLLWAHG